MRRDLICILRLSVDSLPSIVRNSKFFFNFAKSIFKLPDELFTFRAMYKRGKVNDLSIYYTDQDKSLERTSPTTDINSFHLKIIEKIVLASAPSSLADVGFGTGYLLQLLYKKHSNCKYLGLDFNKPNNFVKSNSINFFSGDLLSNLKKIPNNSYDIVICAHVIEHVSKPVDLVKELRRITKSTMILICPLEKEYKWGLNYHVNFFPNSKYFISFVREYAPIDSKYKSYKILGDQMYVEKL